MRLLKLLIIYLLTVTASLCLFSCDFFTTSLGEEYIRKDLSKTLKYESMDELVALLSDKDVLKDPNVINEILIAMGNSPAKLLDLPISNKETILELWTGLTIPMETLTIFAEASTTTETEDLLEQFVSLLGETDTTNIKAAVTLLSNPTTLENADSMTLAISTMSLIYTLATEEIELSESQNTNASDIITAITVKIANSVEGTPPEQIVSELITDNVIHQELESTLLSSVTAVQVLFGTSTLTNTNGDIINRKEDLENAQIAGILSGSTLMAFLPTSEG